MWVALLVCQLVLLLPSAANNVCSTSPTSRGPASSDLSVVCGTKQLSLEILLCPIYFSGYNESLLALNALFSKPECAGTPDWTAQPPVLRFNFSITEDAISVCSNKLMVTEETGSGVFSDFSSVQYINISGVVNSMDPSASPITYRQGMMYMFSCQYPLLYLVNNTQLNIAGVSLAIKDTHGNFISALSMQLYSDSLYTSKLLMPSSGLRLKTRIFVEVRATNLTERFNVMLDRCFASTSTYLTNSTTYDLFIGCSRDGQTLIGVNGESQLARFSFEAFRFTEQSNQETSTFYLTCATRLCDREFCPSIRQNCSVSNSRRRRDAQSSETTTVSDVAMVTSEAITIRVDNGPPDVPEASRQPQRSDIMVGISVVTGVLGVLCVVLLAVVFHRFHWTKRWSTESRILPH